jgi:hypothetical protein
MRDNANLKRVKLFIHGIIRASQRISKARKAIQSGAAINLDARHLGSMGAGNDFAWIRWGSLHSLHSVALF